MAVAIFTIETTFQGLDPYNSSNIYINIFISFRGGACAGLFVDISLFPLDTLKTRLQAKQGFVKAGGFRGVYRGLGPQVVGSAPQAALFFLTYDTTKYYLEPNVSSKLLPFVYMGGASLGETVACLIRCPMEVIKQRRQTSHKHSSVSILMETVKSEGVFKGLYRGFGSMVIREVPFSFIQLPILEYLKHVYRINFKNNIPLESWEVAFCGAIAGGFAGAVTTPLDVVKTRIVLADRREAVAGNLKFRSMFAAVYRQGGIRGLFSGVLPRTIWITLGGYIFFGVYDFSKNYITDVLVEYEEEYR